MFDFLFKTFAEGENVIPKTGMQAIPEQIASKLPAGSIKLKQKVIELNGTTVTMESGEQMHYKAVVIATEEPEYRRLMKQAAPKQFRSQTCVYYSADFAPIDEPILVLNGDKDGIVNNFCVPSNVSPNYAPAGKALMSVSIIGDIQLTEEQIDQSVRATLTSWFGNQVSKWKNLRTYRVKYALPDQSPQAKAAINHNYKTGPLLYNCGDYKETGSINGAMESGRKVAEAIIAEHKKK
jgi:predicted NAD/FAD-dependent oxidoreductase